MNTYIAFYAGKELEVHALTSYAAQCLAVEKFKAPKAKRHMVTVMLCAKDGVSVTHRATD